MFRTLKKEIIYPAYFSEHNPNQETQVIFLMIPNGQRWQSKI